MKLSSLYFTTFTVIPSFVSAAALAGIAPRKEVHSKRGGEVNYLANCVDTALSRPEGSYHVSHIAWYSNVDNSLSGYDVSPFASQAF